MANELLHDTQQALGEEIVKEIRTIPFCIAGCGAVGSLFAEMLVRSGAEEIYLIDDDKVERDNLNRTTAFIADDVGKPKVEALKTRLESIVSNDTSKNHLLIKLCAKALKKEGDEASCLIVESDFVIIAMNENRWRIVCEKICQENRIKYISIGVEVNPDGNVSYDCIWMPTTKERYSSRKGYGHGSYAAIVMEATAAGFGMLLSHLKDPKRKLKRIEREYERFIAASLASKMKKLFRRLMGLLRESLQSYRR